MIETLRAHLRDRGLRVLPSLDWSGRFTGFVRGMPLSLRAVSVAREFLSAPRHILVVTTDERVAALWEDNLRGILEENEVFLFPGLSVRPYEERDPFDSVLENRLKVLWDAPRQPCVIVATAEALLFRLPAPEAWRARTLGLSVGQEISVESLRAWFLRSGFREQPLVENVGDFSIRGCIVDCNPFLQENPLRLELFGDEIESIRSFDLFSQRSVEQLRSVRILPMGEFIRGAANGGDLFRIAEGEERAASLLDWLPEIAVVEDEPEKLSRCVREWWETCLQCYARKNADFAAPSRLWWSPEEWEARIARIPRTGFSDVRYEGLSFGLKSVRLQSHTGNGLETVLSEVERFASSGGEVWFIAPNPGHASRLAHLVAGQPVSGILVGHLSEGFWLDDAGVAYLTDHQIFNRPPRRQRRQGVAGSVHPVISLDSLKPGDIVVHRDHGIGRFVGIVRQQVGGAEVDCVLLEYAGKDRLRFPVEDLHKIEPLHVSEDYHPELHRLGGKAWENAKARVKRRIVEIARELVNLYARRQCAQGFAYPPDGPAQAEFEAAFEYEPTPDQVRATREIKADLELPKPMDRLVCGDVGFGKTEVAMRAMFKVVQSRKQVALLVPTTILAAQHYESLRERFAEWPVNIELVNRYKSVAEKKEIYRKLAEGRVDIVVGTHALLSEQVVFADLGLLVIDEEQRFGVKQKERLRALREHVDTLSMSATPIPRTLHLSMTGVRDISLINTPPRNRLPVDTTVMEFDERVLIEAVDEELRRGGQVFVVYDRVRDIQEWADRVQGWAPQARVAVAHGQMHEKDLETVMAAFMAREIDILVATSIIENGLDVPNANTIIILNAHRFGMSQLYQMRGRVGRSHIHAYAYLVFPKGLVLPPDAQKRLEALQRCTDLGSGYQLAMKDLEIRGAGNLLGEEQHGFIEEVGFETYVRLVREAVEELQGKVAEPVIQPRVELGVDAYLPEHWIEDGLQRIALYQRLARLSQPDQVREIREELRDRYGNLPEPAEMLLVVSEAGLWARLLGIQGMKAHGGLLVLTFVESPPPDLRLLAERFARVREPFRILANTPLQAVIELQKTNGCGNALQSLGVLRALGDFKTE